MISTTGVHDCDDDAKTYDGIQIYFYTVIAAIILVGIVLLILCAILCVKVLKANDEGKTQT